MNFLDAAYQILKEAGKPLRYNAIAQQALDTGLITPKGATPHATMGSRLYVDTKKDDSLFRRTGKGFFTLVPKTRAEQITSQVDQLNKHVVDNLRKRLHTMPANRFRDAHRRTAVCPRLRGGFCHRRAVQQRRRY
ncbi:MAG: winged helix-turn-helix domain-containing protein [Chloroflexi bacterium]|nr:winged helix-turn-helix domain-containing protein [Chloroflexota bacterium]